MNLRDDLNQPVRWKWVVAGFVLYVGAVQEHWAWIFAGIAGAVAVLLYASGARLREIPGQFVAFALLSLIFGVVIAAITNPIDTAALLVGLGSVLLSGP